mmetsp:Transcript_5129/g.11413  ORF Transcript_5129/g.11413 Transcript_5129/m.11413 type:complete len:241 (-) Transcript_5129:297-1019(-)
MLIWASLRPCCRTLMSSSVVSNSFSQYDTLLSSSLCSLARVSTSSSIKVMTFSKLIFPFKAKVMKATFVLSMPPARVTSWSLARAALRCCLALDVTCTKLGLGSVFLNSSKASSSFRILIVSAMAIISSLRSFEISSHSFSLPSQFFSRSARNFLSSSKASWVSSRSWPISVISTANFPLLSVFASMASVWAAISFFFASTNAAAFFLASSSAVVMSSKSFSIPSLICFSIPTISPLCGT